MERAFSTSEENEELTYNIESLYDETFQFGCSKCEERIDEGICPDCGEETKWDTTRGEYWYWCNNCSKTVSEEICPDCGANTQFDTPTEIHWCSNCNVPIIKEVNSITKDQCPLCNSKTEYMSKDVRPVFPEERLLLELLKGTPFIYKEKSIWNTDNRYFINGENTILTVKEMRASHIDELRDLLMDNMKANEHTYRAFNQNIKKFVEANRERLNYLKDEAHSFIKKACNDNKWSQMIVSFSGGKDSTVVSDLVIKALSDPSVVHIFGDTTLEFPETIDYVNRFKRANPYTIVRQARNNERDFYDACDEIGPPSRVMRWCCTMFKTGPINRRINAMFKDSPILTFYGIRKFESVSRSKYDRIYDSPKIKKQKVASPIFYWNDIDIWLYILSEDIDFNDSYRYGYDRVGCWCCPNNSERSHFLSKIYMKDEADKWRNYLIDFANRIGKPDAETYVDSGNWKARQGGYGVEAAEKVKIISQNCTTEENSKIYKLFDPLSDEFYNLFIPFGKVSKELGSKLLNEVLVLDLKTNIPIISIQPKSDEFEHSIKIKTLNVDNHDDLQRMIGYQVRKFNACRKCLGCETVCKYRAIKVSSEGYTIDENKCTRCKMCVTYKHLEYGCLMGRYLFSASEED